MLKARYTTPVLIAAVVFGYAACGGKDAGEETDFDVDFEPADVVTTAPPTATPSFVGTFRNEQAQTGIAVLTLKTNWTYHKEEAIVCVRYPCDGPQENGRFRYAEIGRTRALALINDAGDHMDLFRYLMKGDTLYLASLTANDWQALERSECSWCSVPRDCGLQQLRTLTCAGEWTCGGEVCRYSCGGGTLVPTAETCPGSTNPDIQ